MPNPAYDIKLEPIRHYVEAYGMGKPLPKTEYEAVAYLYEFGFRLFGSMEEMLDAAMKTQKRILDLSAIATFTVPRITEVPHGEESCRR